MTAMQCEDQEFVLLPEKALIWKQKDCLILSDLHLGKITHFRKSGMPLPRSAELDNYDRLSTLLLNNKIKRVLILGDLFHSIINSEWDMFDRFLEQFSEISFELVVGNHDILDPEKYLKDNLIVHGEELREGPFVFTHFPLGKHTAYNICGHVHPAVIMNGAGRQRMRLPCFYFTDKQAIMPAFGTFTGLHPVDAKKGDRIYVIAGNSIIQAS